MDLEFAFFSDDALSVGFTIADYRRIEAVLICFVGWRIGKKPEPNLPEKQMLWAV